MNLLTVALFISIVLTILCVLLIAVICSQHWFALRQQRRIAEFHKEAEPLMKAYLSGSASVEEVVSVLKEDPLNALRLLANISEKLGQEGRGRLHPIFEAFPFVQKELAALKGRQRNTRLQNAELLGYLTDDSAIPALLEALHDEFLDVRLAAAHSLARLGCVDAVRPILFALDAPGDLPERRVAEALVQLGPRAIPPLLDVLNSPEASFSELAAAVRVCGMLRAESAAPRLVELLQHEAIDVRINCVRVLASFGNPAAIPPISHLADDPAWEVRNSVMRALGSMHSRDGIPILLRGLTDSAWWVRYSAAQSLYKLGTPGLDALKDTAARHIDRYARDMSRQILQEHSIHLNAPDSPL